MSPVLLQLIGLVAMIAGTAVIIGTIVSWSLIRIFRATRDIVAFVKLERRYRQISKPEPAKETPE